MSRTRASGQRNDCPNALHRARSELRRAASSILGIVDQLKEVNQDTREHNQYQESMINALAVENFQLKEENGAAKELLISEMVDEEDAELKKLRKEMGAVKRGLEEINEHNPSGRYPVAKLWHVEDNREARLDEIVECMMKKTTPKRKRVGDEENNSPAQKS
ncbi:hypothetical protein DCAR_0624928 [Daucus carota subsp. sativus]|uniref:Uncharacterized protein n=1 Tax=Daucus carota subsp. sativus TaxID=79200 RepID=A0A164W4F8_DAUCS|nr:hypothetical protein DCAR_0624928 [Daucus carota subsp. sativus]